jgi:GT2 family glycosyltransferase
MTTSVDITVPVFGAMHVARPCIESVIRWTDLKVHRLVIADDGSDTHTARALDDIADRYAGVMVRRNSRNLGFVRTCNRAFREARGSHVLLLNSDTLVTPRWIDKFLACFASDPRIGVASPISNFAPHLTIPMVPGSDHLAMNALIEAFGPASYPDVVTPEGYCWMVSRECLAQVGEFDLAFDRGYGEESDYAMRALHHGWRTVCVDDTYIFHRGRSTFGIDQRQALYDRNRLIFNARWGPVYAPAVEAFRTADPLAPLRHRLDGLRKPGVTSAFEGGGA